MTLRFRDGFVLSGKGDLLVFLGPLALAAILVFGTWGIAGEDIGVPPWAFVLLVVGCDVAHVYSTAFRTYLDPEERKRRPVLYSVVPLACFAAGVTLYLAGSRQLFWSVLAYLAAFHFVRQQFGWMAFSARKAGETSRLDRLLDPVAIYNVTLFPLLWWHSHLPRAFNWFVPGDFHAGLPPSLTDALLPVHWAINALYLARQAWCGFVGPGLNRGKLLVWATTWVAWYGGIVILNSDLAFTATNVLAHGIPYLAVVHRYGAARWQSPSTSEGGGGGAPAPAPAPAGGGMAALFRPEGWPLYFGALAGAAFLEEWIWDRFVWHDHEVLFPGPAVALGSVALAVTVALLAVPQATHYVLDAFLWRSGKSNPDLARRMGFSR